MRTYSDAELTQIIRDVIANLENTNEAGALAAVEPLRLVPTRPPGPCTTPREVLEWYAGQILDIVDNDRWFAVNSLINCCDKFAPAVSP